VTGWIVLVVWAAGFAVASRKISVALIAGDEKSSGRAADAGDRAAMRCFGLILGAVWPALLAGAVITGRLPKTDAQLRAEREKLAREIAELEAESERLRREQEGGRTR
jgi:hypothetical protein